MAKQIIGGVVVWICVLILVMILLGGDVKWRQKSDAVMNSQMIAGDMVVSDVMTAGEIMERKLSRLELLRKISEDFYNVGFVENYYKPGLRELWSVCEESDWVEANKLIGAEEFVDGADVQKLFSTIWGGDVTIESGDITDNIYDAIKNRVWSERNRFVVSRSRALEISLQVLRGFDAGMWNEESYRIDDLQYLDVHDDFYVPYLREALRREWIVGEWADSTFEPDKLIVKPEVLSLIYKILNVKIPKDMGEVDYAFSKGLLLRTEMSNFRLPKPIKYGEFRKILLEAKRVFGR